MPLEDKKHLFQSLRLYGVRLYCRRTVAELLMKDESRKQQNNKLTVARNSYSTVARLHRHRHSTSTSTSTFDIDPCQPENFATNTFSNCKYTCRGNAFLGVGSCWLEKTRWFKSSLLDALGHMTHSDTGRCN
jgi:hypothetical protein